MCSSQRLLTISWEQAQAPGGLGDHCLHIELLGLEPEQVTSLVGEQFCQLLAPGEGGEHRLRIEPSLDLPTFLALLRRASWRIEERLPGWIALAYPE